MILGTVLRIGDGPIFYPPSTGLNGRRPIEVLLDKTTCPKRLTYDKIDAPTNMEVSTDLQACTHKGERMELLARGCLSSRGNPNAEAFGRTSMFKARPGVRAPTGELRRSRDCERTLAARRAKAT